MANENKSTGTNWGKMAIRDLHGSIDTVATLKLVEDELATHIHSEVGVDAIAEAVLTALRNLTQDGVAQKASTDLTGLCHKALNLLGDVPAGATTAMLNRIKDFVRGESKRFVSTNGAEGMAFIGRGRGFAGVNVNTPKFVEEYKAAQAKKATAAAAE
jgi:hypothetical protein